MAGGYGTQHQGTDALVALVQALRDEVAGLRQQITSLGIRIDPATNSILVDSGRGVQVVDDDGHVVSITGALPVDFNRADGSRQPGQAVYREDGSLALALADLDPTVLPYKQALQWLDRAGNVVVADDTNGGKGLANPWVGGGVFLADTNLARWPQTTSATFVDIATGWYRVQNPRLSWDINTVCDVGTTGQAKLLVNGVQVGTTQNVTGTFTDWFGDQVALPAGVNIGDIVSIGLQAKRTAGTGAVYAIAQRFEGDQSP
jgi:hypothetical protein